MDSMLYAFLRELATMTNQRFINFAKLKVQQWLGHNAENMDGISTDDIFVVWYSKTLQNHFGAGETDKIKSTHAGRFQNKYQSNYTARSAFHGTVSAN